VEVTATTLRRRRGLRGWLGGNAPPSPRAALFLAVSTFLCGCVLASLLFVGIWRHTASAEARTRAAQQSDRLHLLAAEHTLTQLKTQLAVNQRLLDDARHRADRATTALAHAHKALADTRRADRAITRSLTPRLQDLVETAAALARQTATIESELNALEAYTRRPGAAGVDAGYLATQARYLAQSAAAAAAAAATLAQRTQDAQASFGTAGS